jgi:hypothetical protein
VRAPRSPAKSEPAPTSNVNARVVNAAMVARDCRNYGTTWITPTMSSWPTPHTFVQLYG